jgi:AcrR family transcriptional regulator
VARRAKASKPSASGKKELLRQTMLDAAAKLFAERGFAGTNLQEIADALGISRPLLYYYFPNKEEILASLVEEVTVFSQQQSTRLAASTDTNPGETLRLMTASHAKSLIDHAVAFRVVDRSEADLPAAIRKVHNTAKQAVLDNFSSVIARGAQIGHFRPVDPRLSAFAILGMCNWTAWWFKPSGRLSLQQVADGIADLAVHSVQREEARRPKTSAISDALQILREDIDHLELVMKPRGVRREHGTPTTSGPSSDGSGEND